MVIAKNVSHFLSTRLGQLYKNDSGATAVEFAVLILPFSALLFAIIEISIIFFSGTQLTHSMQSAARGVRTGQIACNESAFKNQVCDGMSGLASCGKIRFDVKRSENGNFGLSTVYGDDAESEEDTQPEDVFVQTGPGDIVIVRAQYFHELYLPSSLTFLSNTENGNRRIISSATAFRNEPFPPCI